MSKAALQETSLSALEVGSTFTYGGVEWIALEHRNGKCLAISKSILENRAFDKGNKNDWACSSLREYLNGEFLEKLLKDGAQASAFAALTIDLTSDDGLKDYGEDICKIGLITCEQYRSFRKLIPNADDWWWTATPYSTESNGYAYFVRYVYSSGSLLYNLAYHGHCGVRPLCNLESDILVSCDPKQITERKDQNSAQDSSEHIPKGEIESGLNALAAEVHKNAVAHGWWDEQRSFPEIIALCHSELSEALEEYRAGHEAALTYYTCKKNANVAEECDGTCPGCAAGKPEGIPSELADCIIRILDYCGQADIDIEQAIAIKHEYNKSRLYRHGGKKC